LPSARMQARAHECPTTRWCLRNVG
jgi:hypothetical protein